MNKYNLYDDLTDVKYSEEIKIIKEFLTKNHDFSQTNEVIIGENKAVIILKDLSQIKEHIIESHLAFLDIHVMIKGRELIYYDDVTNVKLTTDYDPINDCYLYDGKLENSIILAENDLAVFTPLDAHSPLYQVSDSQVIKVVFKFKI